jgi:predicted secreted protein
MTRPARLLIAAFIIITATALPAGAADAPRYNQIHFQVERSRPVDNDRMQAVLAVTAEDENPARLADEINRTMTWAVKTAKTESKIELRTGGYRTHPVYSKNKIQRWRATQELMLESADFAALGTLIGKLQERLQVSAIQFSVSPERRRTVEDDLIAQALDAFKQRAALVRKRLAATSYRVVDASINTGGGVPVPVMMRVDAFESKSIAPPAVQGGTSTVTVNVGGTIELQ